jgi:hypothetical protein
VISRLSSLPGALLAAAAGLWTILVCQSGWPGGFGLPLRDIGWFDLLADPMGHIAVPVPQVLAYPRTTWTLPVVSPRVEGGLRHVEVFREVVDGEQSVESFHGVILRRNPVSRMSDR